MQDIKFDFNDILLKAKISTSINSRYEDIYLPPVLPLMTAPMDTVVNLDNAKEFLSRGVFVTLPRTIKYKEYIQFINKCESDLYKQLIFLSVGFRDIDEISTHSRKIKYNLFKDIPYILIDVANGHMQKVLRYAKLIKKRNPNIKIMVGNIANPQTYIWYMKANVVDYIRVGVGNGCFGKGTRILMGNGIYKNIEDVESGDFVITMNGTIAKVKRLIYKGKMNTITVKTSMSPKDTIVTPKHNYFMGFYDKKNVKHRGYSKSINKYDWSEIETFNNNKTPLFPKSIQFNLNKSFKYDLMDFVVNKKTTKKYKTFINSNYNIGYIFGTFLGDGNSKIYIQKRKNSKGDGYKKSTIGSVHWSFNINEHHIVEKLKKALFDEFNLTPKIKYTKNMIKVNLYNKPLAHLLFEFKKRHKKHLPEKYLVDNKDYLNGIFDGLIDSDGNKYKDRLSFFNTSLKLVELYNIICLLLNKELPNSTIRKNNNSNLIKKSRIGYFSQNLLTPSKRNTKDDKYIINKILNISEYKNVDVYDLEINDDTHSFIADNCIVHNSGCLTTKNTGVGYPNASLIHEIKLAKIKFLKQNKDNNITPPKIIADGGMKEYVDIIKALALGADYVMIGSLFNKSLESAGTNYLWKIKISQKMAEKAFKWGFPVKKYFRGMSTKEAQKALGQTKLKTSEGVVRYRSIEYKLDGWLENFKHYLRSEMSYNGSKTLFNFIGKADFILITPQAYQRFNK